jgi:hypothetical protein
MGLEWHPRSAFDSTNYRKIVSRQEGALLWYFRNAFSTIGQVLSDKSRSLNKVINFPAARTQPGNGSFGGGKLTWKGRQFTSSEGHRRNRNGSYSEGGPFFTYRMEVDIPTTPFHFESTDGSMTYHGPACLDVSGLSTMGDAKAPSSDSSYLDPIGAEAISLVDPSNPNADFGTSLAEIIREKRLSIPGIQGWKRRTEVAKAAGSEYLNAVFGWLPLVDSMKDTAQSVRDAKVIMDNYRGASGTNVRRRFDFDPIVNVEETKLKGAGVPTVAGGAGLGSGFVIVPGVITRRIETTTRRWFSGAFTYHADHENSHFQNMMGYGSEAEKLFGISLTPDIVWELTPWSWAIDWFSNASNVIHNVGAFAAAGLVMRYGYIMEETSSKTTYSMSGYIKGGKHSPGPVSIPSSSFTSTVKRRREANPFGFGLSWDGLSPTQLAITAALGITRLR